MTENSKNKISFIDKMLDITTNKLALLIVSVAVIENLFTFSIYCILGIKPMILITFLGALSFLWCAFSLRYKSLSLVYIVILIYTLVSVSVSVLLTEWGFGFQNYLFTTVPLCFAIVYQEHNFRTVLKYSLFTALIISVLYVGLHEASAYIMPFTGSSPLFITIVNSINALFVIALNYVVLYRLIVDLYRDNKSLNEANSRLNFVAERDFLTGLYNRRFAEKLIKNINKEGLSYYLILCDIDFFKKINDSYGHFLGDKVLEYVAKVITCNLDVLDFAVRWGGEEFLLIIKTGNEEVVVGVIERIIEQLSEKPFTEGDNVLDVTITAGISRYNPSIDRIEDAIKIADNRLYIGKNSGRNKYVLEG